jgi:NADH-quinone oxidoreductase subunit N
VETIDDLTGLGRTHPAAAFAFAICLFSLAGIPPLAGFWGKLELFTAAFSAGTGDEARIFQWLTVIAVLNSAVGAYYYLRIVVGMYLREPIRPALEPRYRWPVWVAVATCAGLSLAFGLYPAPVARATREAAIAAVALPDPGGMGIRSLTDEGMPGIDAQ